MFQQTPNEEGVKVFDGSRHYPESVCKTLRRNAAGIVITEPAEVL